jgi:uncharacterized protein YecT (DUF1311 family)
MSTVPSIAAGILVLCCAMPPVRAQNPGPPPAASSQPGDPCAAQMGNPNLGACYAGEFKSLDQDLNHVYRAALVLFQNDLDDAGQHSNNQRQAFDSTAIADLKKAQDAWIQYRDIQCRAAGQEFEGGTVEPAMVTRCMVVTTRHRIEEIRDTYEIGGRKLE